MMISPLVSHVNVAAFDLVRAVSEFATEADRVGLKSETLLHMPETSISAVGSQHKQLSPIADDVLTICAISVLAAIVSNVLHEGVGHGLIALLTGANRGCSRLWHGRVHPTPVWLRREEPW